MSLDGYLERQLEALKARDLFRDPADAGRRREVEACARRLGRELVDLTSNDYLGLAARGVADGGDVSRETSRLGAGASRLVQGTHAEHEQLEQELAEWVGQPAALLFTSGFAANAGAIGALAGRDDVIVSDTLNHASIIDGCRLSRAQVAVVPHRSVSAVEGALAAARGAAARWVVTESYFSMDGDAANLEALRALCDRYRAFLVVDEAHALGVFGPRGSGRCREAGVRADVVIGTLGKSVGSQGAFVAGSATLRTFLWNRARTFVFSTGMSPALCAWTRDHVRRVREAERERATLLRRSRLLREALAAQGIPVLPDSVGPIVPVLTGTSARALELAARLGELGILVQAIRPPTVPEGFARLRLTATLRLQDEDVDRVATALGQAWREIP